MQQLKMSPTAMGRAARRSIATACVCGLMSSALASAADSEPPGIESGLEIEFAVRLDRKGAWFDTATNRSVRAAIIRRFSLHRYDRQCQLVAIDFPASHCFETGDQAITMVPVGQPLITVSHGIDVDVLYNFGSEPTSLVITQRRPDSVQIEYDSALLYRAPNKLLVSYKNRAGDHIRSLGQVAVSVTGYMSGIEIERSGDKTIEKLVQYEYAHIPGPVVCVMHIQPD